MRTIRTTLGTFALSVALLAGAAGASAQTATTSTTTPGAPNTGSGGEAAANALLLGVSALGIALGGFALVRRYAPRS